MKATDDQTTEQQKPEVVDAETLAAIDKADRWSPDNAGVTFDEALKRARTRNHAWQNAQLDRSA
ncbi:MAG TPA: hypothetical protein VGK19_17885 [Capsulimonadaceae bacterium]|jgi:hypothetical protein